MTEDDGLPEMLSEQEVGRIENQVQRFYETLFGKSVTIRCWHPNLSLRDILSNIMLAVGTHSRAHQPELGEFKLVYDPNRRQIDLRIKKSPGEEGRRRLYSALDYAVTA